MESKQIIFCIIRRHHHVISKWKYELDLKKKMCPPLTDIHFAHVDDL